MKIHACSQPRPCKLPPALPIWKTMKRIYFWRTWNYLMIFQMVKQISWQQPNWFQQRQQMVFMNRSLSQLLRPWFHSALFMKVLTILWKQKLKPHFFMKAWRSPAIPPVSEMIDLRRLTWKIQLLWNRLISDQEFTNPKFQMSLFHPSHRKLLFHMVNAAFQNALPPNRSVRPSWVFGKNIWNLMVT